MSLHSLSRRRVGPALQSFLCATLATAVFSLRWANCLPLSGYMPALQDRDSLNIWGIYLMYVREPFSFPIGAVEGLSFPFGGIGEVLSRGVIPLFAIPLKFLAALFPWFMEFYYFVLVELAAVFVVAYFACRIVDEFVSPTLPVRLLATITTGLSFSMLRWSNSLVPQIVANFPVYVAFGLFYLRFAKNPTRKSASALALVFPFSALVNYYAFYGVSFLLVTCIALFCLKWFVQPHKETRRAVGLMFAALAVGVSLSFGILKVMGQEGNLEVPSRASPLIGRYDSGWGYGGGFGGGFHVADALTFLIPPEKREGVPDYRSCGPTAYLTRLGFPVTTLDLQKGEFTGFSFLGTVPALILLFLSVSIIPRSVRGWRALFVRLLVAIRSMPTGYATPAASIGLACAGLFAISLGYIVHVAGFRLDSIYTPSFLLAAFWPKFMFARALGRFATPMMLFLIITSVVWLSRYLESQLYRKSTNRIRLAVAAGVLILASLHVTEVWGYLKPPAEVVYGNDISNVLSGVDAETVRTATQGSDAIITVPQLRHSVEWARICYSLAFHSGIPISGANVGLGVNPEWAGRFELDVRDISSGNVSLVLSRYGDVAIACPPDLADQILSKSDVELDRTNLHSRQVAILLPSAR